MLAVQTVVHVAPTILNFVAAAIIPAIGAFITKKTAPDWLKFAVLSLLAAFAGVVATAISAGGVFTLAPTLISIAMTWMATMAAHYGYTMGGVQDKFDNALPNFGLVWENDKNQV